MKRFFCALLLVLWASCAFAGDGVIVVMKNTSGAKVRAAGVRSMSAVKSLEKSANVKISRTYDALSEAGNKIFMFVKSDTKDDQTLLAELRRNPNVLAVSPNRKVHLLDTKTPNDPEYYHQWALQAIKAPEVWPSTTGSDDVYVAVIDSGVDYEHEDISANFSHEYSMNFSGFSEGDYDPDEYYDVQDHGTHCAGIIAAVGNNSLGISGVNWQTKIISVRVMGADGSGNNNDIVAGIDYIVKLLQDNPTLNLAAVNLSLGGFGPFSPGEVDEEDAYWLAFKTLSDMNRTVICVAAGNESVEVGAPTVSDDNEYEKYEKGGYVYPASFTGIDNMIVVAAATSDLQRAYFSNYGRNYVDIAAPGNDIFSTVRHEASEYVAYDTMERTYAYKKKSGTSMATPYVVGAAALIKSAYPSATASQIKAAILGGANGDYLVDDGTSQHGFLDLKGAFEFMSNDKAPKISRANIHSGTVGQPYNYDFFASGAGVEWDIIGELPEGLSFNKGKISGTTGESSEKSFVVIAENDYGSDSLYITINIEGAEAPKITTEELYDAGAGVNYDCIVDASGSWPMSWDISGNLPEGLEIDSSTGRISGTVYDDAGTYDFTVAVKNAAGTDTKQFTLTVYPPEPPYIITEYLNEGVKGRVYINESYEAPKIEAYGFGNITFSVTAGELPSGLMLDEAGTISGIPEVSGDFTFTVTAENLAGEDSREYTLTINDYEPYIYLVIKDNEPYMLGDSLTFLKGIYSEYTIVFQGSGPMSFETAGSVLPPGIDFVKGETSLKIAGIAQETGEFSLSGIVENSMGTYPVENLPLYVIEPVRITSLYLPDAVKDSQYDFTLSTLNGTSASWRNLQDMPDGLTLTEAGVITGKPTVSGKFSFDVVASDADFRTFTLIIREAPKIQTASLPDGKQDTAYSSQLTSTGTQPVIWSASGLPAGLVLSSNGYIYGTPAQSGKFTVDVTASNTVSMDARQFTVNISEKDSEKEPSAPVNNQPEKENTPAETGVVTYGQPRAVTSLSRGVLAVVSNDESMIAAVLPELSVDVSGIYSFDVDISPEVPEGLVLVWHSFASSADVAASEENEEDESAVFYDTDGKEITKVPANHKVNVSVWLNAGKNYAPVIAAVKESAQEQQEQEQNHEQQQEQEQQQENGNIDYAGVDSSSGGCEVMSAGMIFAVFVFLKLDRKHKDL